MTLALIGCGVEAGRVEQPVEARRAGDVGAASREVERAHPAEAIAGGDDPRRLRPRRAPRTCSSTASNRRRSFARSAFSRFISRDHRVARRAAEALAEQVGDEGGVAEIDELVAEADLQLGDAHHRREQDHRRPPLVVAARDQHAFEAPRPRTPSDDRPFACSCRLQQPRRLRPRLVGDRRARQHPRDLLAPLLAPKPPDDASACRPRRATFSIR